MNSPSTQIVSKYHLPLKENRATHKRSYSLSEGGNTKDEPKNLEIWLH